MMTSFVEGTYLKYHTHIYKDENMKKLHNLYFDELAKAIKWVKKKFPKYGTRKEMSIYDITLAIGIDWEGRETAPTAITTYLLKEGKIRSKKLEDVAEYIMLCEIKDDIKDDIDEFKIFYHAIKEKLKNDEPISIHKWASELRVKHATLKCYIQRIKDGAK